MPDFWEKDKKVDANDWWAGDTAVADTPANVYSGITDPNEAYKKAVEVQDMAVKYNMPFSVPERYLDLNTGKPVMTWKDLTPEVTGRTKTGIVSTKAKEESRPPAPSPKPQKEKALPKFGGALGTSFGLSGMNLNPENLPAIIEENYDFTNQPAWDSFTVEEYYEQHPEKRPREYKNFIDELMRNFGGGSLKVFAGITGTLATGVEQAWGPSYDEILSTDNLYKYAQRTYEKSRSPELSPAAGGGWKGFVASSVGQAGPYMAAAVGATYLTGSPMGAFGVAFAIEGDDAARTVIENGGTEEQANMHRFVVGTINGVIEHIQISQLYKFANVGRGSVKQIASEAKKRALRKILAQGGKATYKAVTHATREAIEETLQEFTSIAAESRFNEQAWDNASYRLFSSGLGGGVVGLIFGVGGRIGNNGIAILDGRKKGALSKALQKELGVSKTLADKASSMVAEGVPIPEVDQMLSQAKVLGEETALAEVEPAPELTEKAPEPAPVATKPEIAPAELSFKERQRLPVEEAAKLPDKQFERWASRRSRTGDTKGLTEAAEAMKLRGELDEFQAEQMIGRLEDGYQNTDVDSLMKNLEMSRAEAEEKAARNQKKNDEIDNAVEKIKQLAKPEVSPAEQGGVKWKKTVNEINARIGKETKRYATEEDVPNDEETIRQYLEDEKGIEIREDGLIETYNLGQEEIDIIGNNEIVVFHVTSTEFLSDIEKEGLKPRHDIDISRQGKPPAGVYVTLRSSGRDIDGYMDGVRGKTKGEPILLEIKVKPKTLVPDPDDADIQSGGYQFILPSVKAKDIINLKEQTPPPAPAEQGGVSERPLVNPKATALQQDKQLRRQQAWDRKYGKYVSEARPKPLADASKNRRREILQARIKRGESAGKNVLSEFKGEQWADEKLAKQPPTPAEQGGVKQLKDQGKIGTWEENQFIPDTQEELDKVIAEVKQNEGEIAAGLVKNLLDKGIQTESVHNTKDEIIVGVSNLSVENRDTLRNAGLTVEKAPPLSGEFIHFSKQAQPPAPAKAEKIVEPKKVEPKPLKKAEEGKKTKVRSGKINVKVVDEAHRAFMRVLEPSKAVERKLGKDVSATVTRGIHRPDVAAVEFNEKELENLDGTLREFGKSLNQYSNKTLTNLMLMRGKPFSPEAIEIQKDASVKLLKESPELVGLQKMITRISDSNYKYLQEVVGENVNYVEDYFYGIYKNSKKVDAFLDKWWRTTKRFTKQKKLPTVADAMAFGLELRDPNPVNNLLSEYVAIARLDGMMWMKDELLRTGKGKYIEEFVIAPDEWAKVHDPVFSDVKLQPDLAMMINNLIAKNKISQSPVLNTLRQTNNFLRTVKFIGSAFHLLNIAKQSVADSGYLGFLYKKTATRGFTRGFRKNDPIFKTSVYRDYIGLGGGHRYSVESESRRAFSQAVNELNENMGKAIRVGSLPLRIPVKFVEWMFESYIPKVKYSKYLDTVAEKETKLGRELTEAEHIDIIKEGQNFYGMMNERLFGRSGTVTSALRFYFMSPGYAEGNYRTIIKAATQWGGKEGFKANRSRSNIVNSLILSVTAATVGTMIMTGKPPKKPETLEDMRDLGKIDTGKKDDKGRRIMVDMMTYDKDYWQIAFNVLKGRPDVAIKNAVKRIGGMKAPTADMIADFALMTMGRAILDWKDDRITEITDPFLTKVMKLTVHEIKKLEPISVSVFKQSKKKDIDTRIAAIETLMGVRPTMSEKDIRENEIMKRIFSLRGQQEELYLYLGGIKEPRKAINRYNKTVQSILDSRLTPPEMKAQWEPKLIIDTDRLMANKVHSHELLKVSEKPKPDEVEKTGKWLKNFGISESQYRKHLIVYEMKHRKLIEEMTAGDGDDLLKDEIARFYADKGIVDRKVRSGKATDAEKRLAKKYGALGSNISEIGTRIHKSKVPSERKRYYDRIRSVIERI